MLDIKNTVKNNIKNGLNIKGMIQDAKESGEHELKNISEHSVSHDTDKITFIKRYKNLMFSINFLLILMFLSIIAGIVFPSFQNWVVCLLSIVIFGMFYFKYSFMAWRARFIFNNWENRLEKNEFLPSDYIDDVRINPLELFCLKLKEKNNEK
jgi:hypothetical protein